MSSRRRVELGFVEAGVEIGFNLVDLAASSDPPTAARILADAAGVLHDIDCRLTRLADADRASFALLVAELRRELALRNHP